MPKEDHIMGGDLLSLLFQKTMGMDSLPFNKLRKLLSREPSSYPPLNKMLGDESIYYKISMEDESRYPVARKGYCILVPNQCEKRWLLNLC